MAPGAAPVLMMAGAPIPELGSRPKPSALTTAPAVATGGQPTNCKGPKKTPSPRIGWLLKKHGMPHPVAGQKSADDFIQRAFNLVDGKSRIFGISPCNDQTTQPYANAVKWLQSGWCHYFIPEIYQHPADFGASLDWWLSQNTPPDATQPDRKPLVIPALYTSAVEKPDATKTLWPASDVEDEINYARSKGVGQVHFSWRALRPHKHGGPPDLDNVGDHVKGNQYKEQSLVPAAMAPPATIAAPNVSKGSPGHADVSSTGKVRQWAYWLQTGGVWGPLQTASGKKTSLLTGSATRIRVQAVDQRNRKSAVVEIGL
jgi:hypothetical protein